jgi:CheY-like chemotaxis protein
VLMMTPELERRIATNEGADKLTEAAREGGMRSLWDAGVSHVRNGTTDLDELMRVLEAPGEFDTRSTSAVAAQRATASQEAVADPAASASTQSAGAASPAAPSTPASRNAPPPAPVNDLNAAELLPPPPSVKTLHSKPASFDSESFQLLDEGGGGNGVAKKVLLVEDEDALRRVMKDLLEREGFTVYEAADGVIALDEIDRSAPDIVVLDLNLPRLDGYGVLSHLRSRPATATLPVIVLTAKGDEDSEVRVFEYGASDYLTKPFRPRALSARLHSLLSRGRE